MKKISFEINREATLAQSCLIVIPCEDRVAISLKKDDPRLDKAILQFLIELELTYQRKLLGRAFDERSFTFKEFHIPFNKAQDALKHFAAKGLLSYQSKELVCDFFSKVELYYEVFEEDDGLVKVRAKIKERDNSYPLSECDFVCGGNPCWIIKSSFVRMIGTDITWKELHRAWQGVLLWSKDELEMAKEDQAEEPLAPKIVESISISKSEKISPFPSLKLNDRFGMFADLWMNYQGIRIPHHSLSKEIKDSHQKTIKRILTEEKNWEKDLLETGFQNKLVDHSHYYCPADQIYKSLSFLLELGWEIHDYQGNRLVKAEQCDFVIEEKNRQISLKGSLKFENHQAALSQIAGAFSRKEKFIQIAPKVVGLVPQQWSEFQLDGIIEECEIVQDSLNLPRYAIGLLDHISNSERAFISSDIQALRQSLWQSSEVKDVALSSDFTGTLRPYQLEGVKWLNFLKEYHFHGILGDDMGLGKTVQVLAFLSSFKRDKPVLIVMPTSLIFNWKLEIEKFIPKSKILIYHGFERKKEASFDNFDFILTSYSTLRIDLPLFSSISFEYLILDESQAIKNSDSKTFQALLEIKSTYRLSLTGTPMENHLFELWSQFHFLMPELLGSQKDFEAAIIAGNSDSRHLETLKRKIKPFLLRRKKEHVAKDLPEKILQTVWLEMESEQREVYDQFLADAKNSLVKKVQLEGVAKYRMEIFETLLRLRQICCHPLLHGSASKSSKLDQLLIDLETIVEEGKKVLVFSQFTQMLSLIKKELSAKQWHYLYLDGDTKNREELVQQFQNDPYAQIFLISLKAGGVGLNLTAADYVLLYDPWWNEAVENQAIDRAHRIGRKDTVIAKRYIMKETIEEKMMTLKNYKTQLVNQLSSENSWEGLQFSIEDFYALIS